ncbi:MAG: iron-containing alcohol dehydrogenase [Deltaproteobacteria bacterium]|nr:iron-containing alcohol dehydrogenase [Deltaproteobacteria bacterium]
MPGYYEFACPVKILSGNQALSNLPYEMGLLGATKALLVTDKGDVAAGLVGRVKAAFAGSAASIAAVFDETPVDSSDKVVARVARLYRDAGCDCLVAVGGGSCLDTAKGANVVLTEGTEDLLAFQGAERTTKPTKPFVAIPTTAGTGSEVTSAAVITNVDKGIKMAITSYRIYPHVAILDPKMTLSVPPRLTAATGMDAMTHAVEAFYCLQKNPVSDAFAVAAIRLVLDNLVRSVEDGANEQARLGMANAALLAGISFSNSMVGLVHSLAHAAGGVAHVPHGVANAIFLPWGVEYNIGKCADVIAELGPVMGVGAASASAEERARAVVGALRGLTGRLYEICGLPLALKDTGVKPEQLEAIARAAINDGTLAMNPAEVSYEDALAVLRKAF